MNLSLVINGAISSSSKGSFLFEILILFNSKLSKYTEAFLEKAIDLLSSLLLILLLLILLLLILLSVLLSVLFSNFFGNSLKFIFSIVCSLINFLLLSFKVFIGGI